MPRPVDVADRGEDRTARAGSSNLHATRCAKAGDRARRLREGIGSTRGSRLMGGQSCRSRLGSRRSGNITPSRSTRPPTGRPTTRSSSMAQLLGIVEAKKLTPRAAERPRRRPSATPRALRESPFNFRGFRVPFLYSTNGEVIWFHDVRHALNRSRRIVGFHTPGALAEMLDRDFDADCATPGRDSQRPLAAAALPDRGQRRPSRRPSPTASARCSWRWPPARARRSRWSTRSTG